VACLILKVMLEDIPRYGPELADELRRVGKEIKETAEKELKEFYPDDPDGSKPIAYLWARTVRCESPNCGAEIPLVRSFWLCKKPNRKIALRYKVVHPENSKDASPSIKFEIFEPINGQEVPLGTVKRAKATCICCGIVLSPERVRAQLVAQRGGADVIFDEEGNRIGGARLSAIVTLKPNEQGRYYRLPTQSDYVAVWKAMMVLGRVSVVKLPNGLNPVPDEPVDEFHHDVNRMPMYGMKYWGDLFAARQKLSLVTLAKLTNMITSGVVKSLVAFAVSKQSDFNSSLSRWANHMEKSVATFGRQAIPILWDWGEVVPISGATGGVRWL